MLKQMLFFTIIVVLSTISSAKAQEPYDFSQVPQYSVRLPGAGYKIDFNLPEFQLGERRPIGPLSVAIASWLAADLAFPKLKNPPDVEFVSTTEIAVLNATAPLTRDKFVGLEITPSVRNEVSSFYDDTHKVIYLLDRWNGNTPSDISLFVREMVHHLQNEEDRKYESQDARDEIAIAAQNRWITVYFTNRSAPITDQARSIN